jgi:FtsH-binding integral membrane protein
MSYMQSRAYTDQLADQLRASRGLVIGVFVAILVALVAMRLMPEEATPLTGKVMVLLSPTLAAASIGAYVGRNIRGWLPVIGLFLVSAIGIFIIRAAGGSDAAVALLLGWGFVNGMILGPLVGFAIAEEGPGIVLEALVGTTAVMLGAGCIALTTHINLSFLMPLLLLGLLALIVVGLIGIFVRFSRTVNLAYSIIGMLVFAVYFLYDFFRLDRSRNTWDAAVQLTVGLYLDFANFFMFLLRFLLASRRR